MKIEKESLIGKSFPKLDAAERATGRAIYIQDLTLPRMLHAAILRSDRVHARIVSIDTSRAENLPGVKAVITAKDIENVPFGHGTDTTPLEEGFVRPATLSMGSAWDIALSPDPDQTFLYLADGTNNKIWILRREGLEVVGEFGRNGRYAGEFHWVHSVTVDSQGNLYTGEVDTGQRIQKFRPVRE